MLWWWLLMLLATALEMAMAPVAVDKEHSGPRSCEQTRRSRMTSGVRTISDFEAEYQMALTNRHLAPSIESVFVMPSAQYSYVSSSLMREVVRNGGDVSSFLHPAVEQRLRDRLLSKPS